MEHTLIKKEKEKEKKRKQLLVRETISYSDQLFGQKSICIGQMSGVADKILYPSLGGRMGE